MVRKINKYVTVFSLLQFIVKSQLHSLNRFGIFKWTDGFFSQNSHIITLNSQMTHSFIREHTHPNGNIYLLIIVKIAIIEFYCGIFFSGFLWYSGVNIDISNKLYFSIVSTKKKKNWEDDNVNVGSASRGLKRNTL